MQEIRFKHFQFNMLFLTYIRHSFIEAEPKTEKKEKKLLLTQIVDLEFEMKCLQRYSDLVEYIAAILESDTTLE